MVPSTDSARGSLIGTKRQRAKRSLRGRDPSATESLAAVAQRRSFLVDQHSLRSSRVFGDSPRASLWLSACSFDSRLRGSSPASTPRNCVVNETAGPYGEVKKGEGTAEQQRCPARRSKSASRLALRAQAQRFQLGTGPSAQRRRSRSANDGAAAKVSGDGDGLMDSTCASRGRPCEKGDGGPDQASIAADGAKHHVDTGQPK